jgi:hypothetical protein
MELLFVELAGTEAAGSRSIVEPERYGVNRRRVRRADGPAVRRLVDLAMCLGYGSGRVDPVWRAMARS